MGVLSEMMALMKAGLNNLGMRVVKFPRVYGALLVEEEIIT